MTSKYVCSVQWDQSQFEVVVEFMIDLLTSKVSPIVILYIKVYKILKFCSLVGEPFTCGLIFTNLWCFANSLRTFLT